MRRVDVCTATLIVFVLLDSPAVHAQGYGCPSDFSGQPEPPATELVIARWHFGTNGAIRHCGWWHNYPSSDQNLNGFIEDATGIDIEIASYKIVELGSEEVFDYPFAYVSEPGEMELTDIEARNMREFVKRGGFILMDDFDGPWQLDNARSEVLRVFPEKRFLPIPTNHRAFSTQFELANLNGMAAHVPGGQIVYYGLYNDQGELAIAAGHNNDLANFWDWYDTPRMPLKPAADAFRLGINFVVWSMTH